MRTPSQPGFDPVPEYLSDDNIHRQLMARAINRLNGGKLNATRDITLQPSASATTITDPRIAPGSFIGFSPITASAAAAIGAGVYIADQGRGTATISHQAAVATDQTIRLVILG